MARVLVVDDEADIRTLLVMTLSPLGHEVLEAESVDAAREMVKSDPPPEIILLDWMMPGESGLILVGELRRDPEARNIPVIMLTAKAQIQDKEQAQAAGAADYLVKPVPGPMLQMKITEALQALDKPPGWPYSNSGWR